MVRLDTGANDTPTVKINVSNASYYSFIILSAEKYNSPSNSNGSIYVGLLAGNEIVYQTIREGTEKMVFNPSDATIAMSQYSRVRVFYFNCDVTISRQ